MTNAASLSWRSKVFQAKAKIKLTVEWHLENQKFYRILANKIKEEGSHRKKDSSHALITKVIDSSHRSTYI